IPVVPIYFALRREVINRDGILIPVSSCSFAEDAVEPNAMNDEIETVMCRFRSLGCIPCTGAIASTSVAIDDIIREVEAARKSERENRVIDLTSDSSMEQKKKEGYF
ncbi:MAG: hypothetical protein MUO28_00895, partial [Desulfobacterales bacterium]|nr:hypothetical protein [Desulfobacterales bacterium]